MSKQKYTEHPRADYDFRGEYTRECDLCQKQHTVFTQRDNHPEYYTDVFVKCDCGNHVQFTLPVN